MVEMPDPKNAGELQQLMGAINWMRQHIPQYAVLAAPILAIADAAAKNVGSRKSKQLSKFCLWNQLHVDALGRVRMALMKMVPLAHPDPAQAVCPFCDASQDLWGPFDLGKPLSEWAHVPLAFLSGRFAGAQLKWSTIEKEVYAIVESAKRLEYLLLRPGGFHLFTDHRNLVYMINLFATDSGLQRYQVDKHQRWSMTMTTYRYVIEHIRGEDNVGQPDDTRRSDDRSSAPSSSWAAGIAAHESSFEWPTLAEICAAQQLLQEPRPELVT
ncbi:hypothetical protein PHMEG_00025403 [Phytophthora megakarya]|uniref:Reverse transcriptase RNase H-like domain-containing protein n=1 Tax=Phytophthora megakarya TaxID=4795 RepID=A0A225VEN7_9STRA|nr:hypothetical protein PHMEG_00025403 [Phytophthora megakarya]